MAAYHTICTKCAGGEVAIAAMEKYRMGPNGGTTTKDHDDNEVSGTNSDDAIESHIAASNDPGHEEVRQENNDDDANADDCPRSSDASTSKPGGDATCAESQSNSRRIRVCAMCTREPALSKYDKLDGEGAGELIARIQELEDALESGMDSADGHKLTLREVKAIERQLDKLRLEIKEKGKKKKDAGNEDGDDGRLRVTIKPRARVMMMNLIKLKKMKTTTTTMIEMIHFFWQWEGGKNYWWARNIKKCCWQESNKRKVRHMM